MSDYQRNPERWAVEVSEDLLSQIALMFRWFKEPESQDSYRSLVLHWARAIGRTRFFPPTYQEALDLFVAEADSKDDPPMPGDILRNCRRAAEQMEVDPFWGPKLQEWRAQRFEERESKFR